MNRTIEDIQKDIELLGIKGGYDVEQLLTPQDCRRLSYEIDKLHYIINELEKDIKENEHLRTALNSKESIIKEVRECINHYETIRGYYEYQELGYDEYNSDDDLKEELLEMLDKVEEE